MLWVKGLWLHVKCQLFLVVQQPVFILGTKNAFRTFYGDNYIIKYKVLHKLSNYRLSSSILSMLNVFIICYLQINQENYSCMLLYFHCYPLMCKCAVTININQIN